MTPLKAILWTIFISVPSIIIVGYAVYKVKELLFQYGFSINENIYWIILFVAMLLAMWISSMRVFRYLFPKDSKE
jgi:hypothetical protein